MKSLMRWMPSGLLRCVTSTITSPLATMRSLLPWARSGDTPRAAAPRRYDRRRPPQLVAHGESAGAEAGEGVVAVRGPAAVAMPAQVQRDRTPARARERGGRVPPCMARLPATVHQQHGPRVAVPVGVRDERDSLEARESDRLVLHGGSA